MYKPGQLSVLCIQTVLASQLTRREPLNGQRCSQIRRCNCAVWPIWAYGDGTAVEKDESEASKWYKKAAEQNFKKAQIKLSEMYKAGIGVEQDLIEADKWLKRAVGK